MSLGPSRGGPCPENWSSWSWFGTSGKPESGHCQIPRRLPKTTTTTHHHPTRALSTPTSPNPTLSTTTAALCDRSNLPTAIAVMLFLQRSAVAVARRAAVAPVLRRSIATTVVRRESHCPPNSREGRGGGGSGPANWHLRTVARGDNRVSGRCAEPPIMLSASPRWNRQTLTPSTQSPPPLPTSPRSPFRRSLVCPFHPTLISFNPLATAATWNWPMHRRVYRLGREAGKEEKRQERNLGPERSSMLTEQQL